MVAVFPILYFGWTFLKKVKTQDPANIDVFRLEKLQVDDYQETYVPTPPRYVYIMLHTLRVFFILVLES